jgi:hypothetical protein
VTASPSYAHGLEHVAELVERALQLPEPPNSWWNRAGISPRAERWLEVASSLVLGLVAVAWIWTIVQARSDTTDQSAGETTPATRSVAAALTNADAPSTAYLTGAALEALVPQRGASGKVRVVVRTRGDTVGLPEGVAVSYGGDSVAPGPSAVGQVALKVANALRPVADLNVVTLTPLTERKGGRIGLYYIGSWPTEHGARGPAKAPAEKYAAPRGLIEVTPETQDTRISEHLRIRDFLTHDQANVWPKYVVIQPTILDKDELVLADLEEHGIPAKGFHVMSGFRSPQYNAGSGDKTGRANLSRHMYGDANDTWIDNDGDGQMDDLNHDGRIDIRDSQVMCDAVERVERAHPELVGGCGVYPGNGAHGPFTHIDARGYRARWTGGSNGG